MHNMLILQSLFSPKIQSMLRNPFIRGRCIYQFQYTILFILLLMVHSCKKEPTPELHPLPLFDYSLIKNAELKEIAADIEANKTRNLGAGLLQRNGQPLWDNAVYLITPTSSQIVIHVNGIGMNPNNTKTATGKQWLIPFTKGKSKVDAVLVCQKTDQGFYYNLITENTIKTVKPKDINEQINKQVLLYAKLNTLVYNRTQFPEIKVKDFNLKAKGHQRNPNKRHFGEAFNGERTLAILSNNIQADGRIVNALSRFCVVSNRSCNCPSTWPQCDYCYDCCESDCMDVWVPNEELVPPGDGSGSSGSSGGNGGGLGGNGMYAPVVQALASKVTLSIPQLDWLNYNEATANELLSFLLDENEITNDIVNATLITINVKMANLIEGPYDETYNNLVGSSIPLSLVLQRYMNVVWLNMAMIKIDHPNWSYLRLYWAATKETIQTGLDVLGLFPVIGSIANVVNGGIYSLNGEGTMATLSFATAIPIAGWYAAGVKAAKKTVVITATSKTALKWILRTDNIINFGDRGQLRRVLGLIAGDARQAHHLIPWEFTDHAVVQAAAKGTNPFHMNELLNGIPLDKSVHIEGMVHDVYNNNVNAALEAIRTQLGSNINPTNARQAIEALIVQIKAAIAANPGVNLNNIIF